MKTPFEKSARAHIASRGSPGTREIYLADLARWLLFCQLEKYDAEEPSLEAAVAFRDALQQKLADQTVRRILSALSSMYDAHGGVNPFKSSKRLPRPAADDVALTKAFTQKEAEELLQAAKKEHRENGRDYLLMRLLYDTGMRVGSVVALKREQVYQRSDGQWVIVTKVKKRGRVEIEVPSEVASLLGAWLEKSSSRYVFPSSRREGPLDKRTVNKWFESYGKLARVEHAAPHRFRATYITEALDAGIPLNEVQAAVHHSDPKTTQRYDRGVRGRGVSSAVAKFRAQTQKENGK